MKIVLVNQEHAAFSGPGGAERSVQSIAEHLAHAGHRVTFIAMARNVYTRDMQRGGIHSVREINGVKTILMAKKGRVPTHADLLVPVILRERPDVVHTNVFHRAPQLWQGLAPLDIPVLHTLREYKLMCDRNMFDGERDCGTQCAACFTASNHAVEMSRHVEGVVGISEFTLKRHLDRGLFADASLARVIPNSYRRRGAVPPARPLGPGIAPRVGFLGRLHASKGINLVIDAFSQIDPAAVSLAMAGDLQDEQILDRVRALGETHDARYLGFVDPTSFFAEIDVLLAPSVWHEPFGRITIEAFAHGVPVIATDRGGLPDIVTHGETGWVFDPDQPQQLIDILKELGTLDSARWDTLRANALASTGQYLPEVVGDQYLEAYEEVIGAKAARRSPTTKKLLDFYERDARRDDVLEGLRSRRPLRERRPLKVLIVSGEFPKLSETFVLNHVTGLLDMGVDVRVLITRKGAPEETPVDYLRYDLEDRVISITPNDREAMPLRALGGQARQIGSRLGSAFAAADVKNPNAVATLEQAKQTMDKLQNRLMDIHAAQAIGAHIDDVDVIHCHFGHRPRMIYKYLDMIGAETPMVCSYHGIDMSAHIQSLGPGLYDDVKGRLYKALPVSRFFRERLIDLGFAPKDVQVHRVGVDTAKFTYSDRRRGDVDPLRLVSVGRCVFKKGFEFGIRAVAAALVRRPDIDLTYTLIGDGIELPNLQALVHELGIADRVFLLGARPHDEVMRYLGQSHAMLAPSITGPDGDMEGVPTVTMEAMAAGLPVLSTRHSGIPEAVIDGYCGLLADELDVEAFADNIITLYDNPALGSRFGRQGRAHVLSDFNIERQNRKILDLYERIAFGTVD